MLLCAAAGIVLMLVFGPPSVSPASAHSALGAHAGSHPALAASTRRSPAAKHRRAKAKAKATAKRRRRHHRHRTQTSTVKKTTTVKTATATANCFPTPGACGFPDPSYHNVGATSSCSALPSSGSITASTTGEKITNLDVSGTITVSAPDVTISNVCVTTDGGGQVGTTGIRLEGSASRTILWHVTVSGANDSTESIEQAVANDNGGTAYGVALDLSNCGECVWGGPWTVVNSYVITNGMQGTSDHLEDVYCSDSTVGLYHDTLLNPADQNSVILCDTHYGQGGPCDNHITIHDSLMAGGGFVIYTCANASGVGSSTMSIVGNRFARCLTTPLTYNAGTGGTACGGSTGTGIGSGADSHGYWPNGGYFSPVDSSAVYCPPTAGQAWSSNVWDDNGATVAC